MKQLLINLIALYQKTLSPDHGWISVRNLGGYCRFQPTCSEYAKQSIEEYGVIKGSFLAIARISRCHPWAPVGLDPVPDKSQGRAVAVNE
ncbi:MAG: membrane protein insertion efficiency factor YidD [Patescibacteria group bacterium]